jgi:3-dehydroquinate dehydratase II
MKILYLFGPNLGALGARDPERYGKETLHEVMESVVRTAKELDHFVAWRQTDAEGELIGYLLGAPLERFEAVVLNPGALAHYSYALRDAVEACDLPVVEVHQTNIYARESFRQHSVISGVCAATIAGVGVGGYHLALEALAWITR